MPPTITVTSTTTSAVEHERPDKRAAEHDSDNSGQADPLHSDRPHEQHEGRDEECPFG
jgi:hypothetical protein